MSVHKPTPNPEAEKQEVLTRLIGYFAGAEKRNPHITTALAPLLVNVLTQINKQGFGHDLKIPKWQAIMQKMAESEGNLGTALDFLGNWLKRNGCEGFDLNYDFLTRSAAEMYVSTSFPQVNQPLDTLLRSIGLGNDIPAARQELVQFSRTVGWAYHFVPNPLTIVGGLMVAQADTRPQTEMYKSQTVSTLLNQTTDGQAQMLFPYFQKWYTGKSLYSK